jgi:galactosylceramidase
MSHPDSCLRSLSLSAKLAGSIVLCATLQLRAADRVVLLNGKDTGRVFEGLGALSAGASSRLLMDYPEPQRSQILDLLFKPNCGASLQHLKVEVGGDVNSTDGTEPSIARTAAEFLDPKPEYFKRGYEWWLMKEAKRRNPEIILDCLPWGAPGWIGAGKFYSQDMADYTVKFIQGAKQFHRLELDYCGIWNETPFDAQWIKLLRQTLDAQGLQPVQIVGADQCRNQWAIAAQMQKDPKLMEAVSVIGEHYPGFHTSSEAQRTGKRLWSSEDGPWRGDWTGACALARIYNRNYILGRMTKTTIWSLITSYYENLPIPNSGPMKANTPWSGHYEIQPALWAIAHTTQFAPPGWQYLDGSCVPLDNGSVVALASPDRHDFSVIIESVDARQPQTLRFQVAGGLPAQPLHVWRSDAKQQFIHIGALTPANNAFEVTVDAGCLYSLTTTTGQRKGGLASIPAAKPFPMPYEDGFDSAKPGTMPRYFSDQGGIFEVARRADGKGNCARQFVSVRGIDWLGHPTPEPYTMIGSTKWRDYEVSCDVRVEQAGYAAVFGRITKSLQKLEPPLGYWLKAGTDGTWELKAHTNALATGKVAFGAGVWHTLRLQFAGNKIAALIDGAEVQTIQDTAYRSGMTGLGTGWNTAEFDNFSVRPLPGAAPPPNLAEGKPAASSSDWNADFTAANATDGDENTRWNSRDGTGAGEWLEVDLGQPVSFNQVVCRQFENRIQKYKIQYWDGQAWKDAHTGGPMSDCQVDNFPVITAQRVRLLIVNSTATPSIYELEIYANNGAR